MRVLRSVSLALALASLAAGAQGQLGKSIPNWTLPPNPSASSSGGLHLMNDVTNPVTFIGVTPCRVVDTRRASGAFGGPSLTAGSPRNFDLPAGPCSGIPVTAQAYSLNVTATLTQGPGFLKIFPQGASSPVVSTLNYIANQTVANAAIVPAGTGGGITVAAGVSGAHLIIDINGYYGDTPSSSSAFFSLTTNSTEPTMVLFNGSTACSSYCGLNVGTAAGIALTAGSQGSGSGDSGGFVWTRSTAGNAAGLRAVDGGVGPSFVTTAASSGVRGESFGGFGVFGLSAYQGVVGLLTNGSGAFLAEGDLGVTDGVSTWGVYSHGNLTATGVKAFVEPHPTDASRVIRYVSLEGPESGTYFRGSSRIVEGSAVIDVPESFRIVTDTDGLTVQVTPIGELAMMAVASKDLDHIVVLSSKDVAFDYLVHGVRRAFKNHSAIAQGREFMPRSPEERMPAYLTEEARRRLIANGTYNEDGTVNRATAERLGWTRIWAEREATAREAAQRARQEAAVGR